MKAKSLLIKQLVTASFTSTLLLTWSCSDFLEVSVDQSEVVVLAPLDSARVETDEPLFWWDSVPGAIKYQIQVVSPSFADIETLVYDTLVNSTKLSINLEPGSYQWRIRALDEDRNSDFFTYTLFVSASPGRKSSLNSSNRGLVSGP
jgi:hypothetical protein